MVGGDGKGIQILGVYNDRIGKFDGKWLFVERYFDVHYRDDALPGESVVDYTQLPKF
ncbi:MAG: hypothetical protein AB7F98_13330 [Novosphingobium sp.]